jgi:hypothetical protein
MGNPGTSSAFLLDSLRYLSKMCDIRRKWQDFVEKADVAKKSQQGHPSMDVSLEEE